MSDDWGDDGKIIRHLRAELLTIAVLPQEQMESRGRKISRKALSTTIEAALWTAERADFQILRYVAGAILLAAGLTLVLLGR